MSIVKKVRFSSNVGEVLIPNGDEEDRRGKWMQMAADRARFKRRILQIEKMLEVVLMKKDTLHSSAYEKVYQDQRSDSG